jgi:hypothetical protein
MSAGRQLLLYSSEESTKETTFDCGTAEYPDNPEGFEQSHRIGEETPA